MESTLYAVMRECRNYFIDSIEKGTFHIQNHELKTKDTYKNEQYVLLSGSVLNDGVYKLQGEVLRSQDLKDESFKGAICGLRIPLDFLALVHEIELFTINSAQSSMPSNIVSETYRGYTYTVATNAEGQVATWKDVYKNRLDEFRKMFAPKI